MIIYEGTYYDWSYCNTPIGIGSGDGFLLSLKNSRAQTKLYLGTGKIVEVAKDPVDKIKDMKPCLLSAVSQVFDRDLVHITGLSWFHFCMKNVVEIFEGHWGNLEWLIAQKFEDVQVVQFT